MVVMPASSKVQASKKLTPQQRAIEKKRAQWREWRASGLGWAAGFDPETYDWKRDGEHFDKLSDDEWAVVWKRVRAASCKKPSLNEASVRALVDDAAYSSGWFAEFGGELYFSRADYHRLAETKRRFLKKVQQFRNEISNFFGAPPDDHKEPYDPWEMYRQMVPVLAHLAADLGRRITDDEENALLVKGLSNAAKPKLDIWRARLVMVWQSECGLPVKNTKHLRGFLIDALQPYMPQAGLTDRMAKHFIKKWIAGEVKKPGMSLLKL